MTMRHEKLKLGPGLAVAAFAAALLFLSACNALEKESDAMSQLIVETMTGTTMEGAEAGFLQSDVLFQDPETGAATIFADPAVALFNVRQLDPKPLLGPSPFADVTVTRYTVSYARADGKNIPGIDVPFGFEGSVTIRVQPGALTPLSFIVVRETAKQEPPLLNILQAGTRAEALAVTARVDFYGHDGSNKMVKATGYLPIYFANYANSGGGQSGFATRRGGRP
jgi:hypothetical protein